MFRLLPSRSQRGLRNRLQLMVKHGFVDRLDRSARVSISCPFAFCLSRKGQNFVAEYLGFTLEDLYTNHSGASIGAMYLRHYARVNDMRILFEDALETHKHLKMGSWLSEYTLKDPLSPVTERHRRFAIKQKLTDRRGEVFPFEPDSVFFAHRRDQDASKQVMFCIEVDRGTESMPRVERKQVAYDLFNRQKLYTQHGALAMRVLWVFEDEKRLGKVQKRLAKYELPKTYLSSVGRLLPLEPGDPDAPCPISSSVWTGCADGQRTPLFVMK